MELFLTVLVATLLITFILCMAAIVWSLLFGMVDFVMRLFIKGN